MKALIAFAIVLGSSAPALACSARNCAGQIRFPVQEAVPANGLYFEVLVDDPGRFELRDSAGVLIPASIRTLGTTRVFAPDVPLTPGQTVEVTTDNPCELLPSRTYQIEAAAARDGSARCCRPWRRVSAPSRGSRRIATASWS